jgi:hypothetical protein
MVDALVRSFIGQAGSALLDFYIQYSLVINGSLLLYAVVLVASRKTYATTQRALIAALQEKHALLIQKKSRQHFLRVVKKSGIPWEAASRASRFPFITGPSGLIVYPKTRKRLEGLFDIESLTKSGNH